MADSRFRRSAGGVSSLGLQLICCPTCRSWVLGCRIAGRLNELLDESAAEYSGQLLAREIRPDHGHIFVVAWRFKRRASGVVHWFAWLGRRRRLLSSEPHVAASVGCVSEQTLRRPVGHRREAA